MTAICPNYRGCLSGDIAGWEYLCYNFCETEAARLNSSYFVVYFIIMMAVLMTLQRSRRHMMKKIIGRKKSLNREGSVVNEAIKMFLGKECVVYTFENTSVKGIVEAAEDGWLRIKTKKGQQLVNPDFVSRIREV